MDKLTSVVEVDSFTEYVSSKYDYKFDGNISFEPHNKPELPENFKTLLITGSSGSGKSTLLKEFGSITNQPQWIANKAIVSNFNTPEEATELLSAVGLNSVPSWFKPYNVLSNGEQFRANLARQLKSGAIIDEFTSVIDRTVAKAACNSISKYIKQKDLSNIIFSSCHSDIIEWLQPQYVFDCNTGSLIRGCQRRPSLNLAIYQCSRKYWDLFRNHHYLDTNLNFAAKCYLATWNGIPVAFNAVLNFPSGSLKKAYRGHRLVVLPDYQGLGFGVALVNYVAQKYVDEGKRYFARTTHPRLGEYREKSPLWKATSANKKKRKDTHREEERDFNSYIPDANRICYSHEYIGR